MEPEFDLVPRVGTFFLLIGCGLMVLFIGSDFSQETNFNYFFMSLAALFVGYLLRRRASQHDSGRFGSIRAARRRSRERRDEKRKRQQEKQQRK